MQPMILNWVFLLYRILLGQLATSELDPGIRWQQCSMLIPWFWSLCSYVENTFFCRKYIFKNSGVWSWKHSQIIQGKKFCLYCTCHFSVKFEVSSNCSSRSIPNFPKFLRPFLIPPKDSTSLSFTFFGGSFNCLRTCVIFPWLDRGSPPWGQGPRPLLLAPTQSTIQV